MYKRHIDKYHKHHKRECVRKARSSLPYTVQKAAEHNRANKGSGKDNGMHAQHRNGNRGYEKDKSRQRMDAQKVTFFVHTHLRQAAFGGETTAILS